MPTLFLIVFLDLVGFGMIIPVFPFYAERVGVDPASVIFYLGLYSLGQLLGAPVWGALSDRTGRRPILLATLLANTAGSLLLAWADSGLTLAISRIVAGLAAGNISTAYAYTTDITTDATRPKALGLLGSAFGLGFIAGPAIGGLIAGNDAAGDGLVRVAYAAALLSLAAFALTLARLPESLTADVRATARKTARPRILTLARRPGLRDLLATTVVVVTAVAMLQSTLAVWAAESLRIGPGTLGWVYGFVGVVSVIGQVGLVGPLTTRFGALRIGQASIVLASIGMALVPPVTGVWALLVPLAVFGLGSALLNPTLSNLAATLAAPHERGAVLGAYQSGASLGRVIGPFTASAIAARFGLASPFTVGAVVALLGIWFIRGARRRPAGPATEASGPADPLTPATLAATGATGSTPPVPPDAAAPKPG